MEIERHPCRIAAVLVADARHVAILCPRLDLSVFVVTEACETATRDDGFYALVERGGEHGVVTAEGMPDAADAVEVHFRKRLEEIDSAQVVPNRLHRAAVVSPPDRAGEVEVVLAEGRVVGHHADVAAIGELVRIAERRPASQAGGLVLADLHCLVQAEHRRRFPGQGARNQQIRGYTVACLRRERELLSRVALRLRHLRHLYIERNATFGRRQWTHRELHTLEDVLAAPAPLVSVADGLLDAAPIEVDQELAVVCVFLR